MAERRMFAKTIIDSDAFLDMPLSAQALYFHLAMRADDDGFVNNPKQIQRGIGASDDDCKLLIIKKFIISFANGVIVIKHWRMHNYIQSDRYKPTVYKEEKATLSLDENKAYTQCIQNGYKTDTQVRLELGKDSIGKDRLDNLTISNEIVCQTENVRLDVQPIIESWNSLSNNSAIKPISKLTPASKRYQSLVARIKEYSLDDVLKAIENVSQSKFLKGDNNKSWIITFDWLVKPNNFPKVLEGNYNNTENMTGGDKDERYFIPSRR